MADSVLTVKGIDELARASGAAARESRQVLLDDLRQAGDTIKGAASGFFAPVNSRTAAGFRVVVRSRGPTTGVTVGQTVGKTTGKHPGYGALQMRVMLRAAYRHLDDLEQQLAQDLEQVGRRFEQ